MTDIFISYSHQDERWKDELKQQLQVLQLHAGFAVWDDRQIAVGDNCLPVIEQAIAQARIAVLLVSSDFLTSNFIVRQEIPKFLQRREQQGLCIVPVVVRPCAWKTVPWLASLQGATKDNKPLSAYAWGSYELEQAFSEITERVHALLLEAKPPLKPTPNIHSTSHDALSPKSEPSAQYFIVGNESQIIIGNGNTQKDQSDNRNQSAPKQDPLPSKRNNRQNQWLLASIVIVPLVGAAWWFNHTSESTQVNAAVSVDKPLPTNQETSKLAAAKPATQTSPMDQPLPFEPEMVKITAGSFEMGCKTGRDDVGSGCSADEKPLHSVKIAAFALGRTEITKGQFRAFIEATNYKTTAEQRGSCWGDKTGKDEWDYVPGNSWLDPGFAQTDDHPVVCVSWDDAQAYVKWLRDKTQKDYRLATEAEWEYAARGGKQDSAYPWGQKVADGCQFANMPDQTAKKIYTSWSVADCNDGYTYTAPVKSFHVNGYRLADMQGNVWEWVQDCYHDNYQDAPNDGKAWDKNCNDGKTVTRVLRGGSWNDVPESLRSANRSWNYPLRRSYGIRAIA